MYCLCLARPSLIIRCNNWPVLLLTSLAWAVKTLVNRTADLSKLYTPSIKYIGCSTPTPQYTYECESIHNSDAMLLPKHSDFVIPWNLTITRHDWLHHCDILLSADPWDDYYVLVSFLLDILEGGLSNTFPPFTYNTIIHQTLPLTMPAAYMSTLANQIYYNLIRLLHLFALFQLFIHRLWLLHAIRSKYLRML